MVHHAMKEFDDIGLCTPFETKPQLNRQQTDSSELIRRVSLLTHVKCTKKETKKTISSEKYEEQLYISRVSEDMQLEISVLGI